MEENLVEQLNNLKIFQLKSEKAKQDRQLFIDTLINEGPYDHAYTLLNTLT